MMIFKNRNEAGYLLAKALSAYLGQKGVVVAIPRGGLPVGHVLAKELQFPLEVVLTKKIGHPRNPEYAIGALSLKSIILSEHQYAGTPYLEREVQRLRNVLQVKQEAYQKDRSLIDLRNKLVILTDDGVATGWTMVTAIDLIRKEGAKTIVVATPVIAPSTIPRIKHKADSLVYLQAPEGFRAVANYYKRFTQLTDQQAIDYLEKSNSLKI